MGSEANRAGGGRSRVVIVGGGFGGLEVARGLARAAVDVTLIDQRNHHLFQPLLYQVASAALSPAHIAAPIRGVLGKQSNCRVLMGKVTGVDVEGRAVLLGDERMGYDYLVLAAGATHSYFGNEGWAVHAPGLKTIDDAVSIRRRFLTCFEMAERTGDPAERDALLTFVVVGGGPTGVEMAGAMKEIALRTIPQDFRAIDTRRARVILVEAQERVLAGGFEPELSSRALAALERMEVEVRLLTRVVKVDASGVELRREGAGDGSVERIASRQVVWAAGVRASGLGAMTGGEVDRAGRVRVGPDLSVAGRPEVFVIGDLAAVMDSEGKPVPGVAPAAVQMGRYVARVIRGEAGLGAERADERAGFVYRDKGSMATIGRAKAVADVFGHKFSGFVAWLLWAVVHIFFLIGFGTKVLVVIEWVWAYVTFRRGARLITGEAAGAGAPDAKLGA